MSKPRRDIPSLIKAHEMDLKRKTLFVEGNEDRLFLEYIVDKEIDDDICIYEIDSIECPSQIEGGEKGRILYLSELLKNKKINIHFFIDSDFHGIMNIKTAPNVILTDFRDIEAYLYDKEYFKKFIRIGLKSDRITADYLWDEICKCKEIGYLRLCSEINKYKLPFKRMNENFHKYYKINADFSTSLLFDKYKKTLIQLNENKINISDLEINLRKINTQYEHLDCRLLIHGKDTLNLVKEIAKKLGVDKINVEAIFWMSFEKEDYRKFEKLKSVIDLLKN